MACRDWDTGSKVAQRRTKLDLAQDQTGSDGGHVGRPISRAPQAHLGAQHDAA